MEKYVKDAPRASLVRKDQLPYAMLGEGGFDPVYKGKLMDGQEITVKGEEKMLVYEYVHNTSLDSFLFDPIKCLELNWERRNKIIIGIARGLVYLHEDSD
ncbi:cysteine-rich receptor-like protein kinase 44 [Magnolia sinica]|uniref:cysteine-rich receptor-like protein kinase 44 n=1 Tax=Magnolia sinica TaxID=86752 RepID=UPI00265A2B65|nr:cysteine-rich receptor-like protein kinase 44 [Magnolia sinica]